jgi:hypothetical protein
MIRSVVEKDTLTTWSVGEVIFGKEIVKIDVDYNDDWYVTLYAIRSKPLVMIPMTSVQRIIYEVGE